MEQIVIAFTGVIAIFLTQQNYRPDWKKFACLFGVLGQPFWMYAAYTAGQWGILVLTLFYSYSWLLGVWNYWIKKPVDEPPPKDIHSNPSGLAWAEYFKKVFPSSDVELMHVWFSNAMMAMHDHIYNTKVVGDMDNFTEDQLKPSEAVYGFSSWLTTRDQKTTMGAAEECSVVATLVDRFCKENRLSAPREGWHNNLIHPSNESSGAAT